MNLSEYLGLTLEQRNAQQNIIADQRRELVRQSEAGKRFMLVTVTCPCGRERGTTHAVRCLYCNIWYCETCAEDHFGQTRDEYRASHPIQETAL